jgi:hypothetical protein
MCFNIGVIIGPILGGLSADPARSYPNVFGHVEWLQKFPYAPPNILSAFFLAISATSVFLGLEEASQGFPYFRDYAHKSRLTKPCVTEVTLVPNAGRNWQIFYDDVADSEDYPPVTAG